MKKPSNTKQFLKYMAGGSLYFWSGYAIFAICYSGFKWNWLPSKILADAIGWTLNYLVQRFWAFSGQHHLQRFFHRLELVVVQVLGFSRQTQRIVVQSDRTCYNSPYVFIRQARF